MKKLSHVFFLFLLLAAVGVLAAAWVEEGFSLVQEVPKPLKPGQQATVKVVIKPGNIKGFVKLQLELPKGFTAQAVETNGGVFSMLNGSVSLVWMEFPSAPTFQVLYKLQVPKTAIGNETIEGRLAFLLKGEKRMLNLDPTLIEIVPESESVTDQVSAQAEKDSTPTTGQPPSAVTATSAPEPTKTTDVQAPAAGSTTAQVPSPVATASAPTDAANSEKKESQENKKTQASNDVSSLLKVHREVTPINQNELSVKVVVDNLAGLKSFAKYEEMIPLGFKAKAVQTKGAAFTFMKNQVRILWNQMPMEESFSTTYKIIRDGSEEKTIDLEADFYFLLEGEAEVMPVIDRQLKFGDAPAAPVAAAPKEAAKPTNEKSAKPVAAHASKAAASIPSKTDAKSAPSQAKAAVAAQPAVSAPTMASQDSAPSTVAEVSAAKSEEVSAANPLQPILPARTAPVQYKVQVCALRAAGAAEDVAKFLKLDETPAQEMHEGWHKFTLGNYPSYAEAKSRRNELGALPTGPFVAAYNQGTRITVQEALLVTRQKWVK